MKHRGPSSSLNPAREAARAQARTLQTVAARTAPVRAPAGLPAGWAWATTEDGSLAVVHTATGAQTVIATPPTDQDQEGPTHG